MSYEIVNQPDIDTWLREKGIEETPVVDGNYLISIGFCRSEQRWYGWTHRGRKGFGLDTCATLEDARKAAFDYARSMD